MRKIFSNKLSLILLFTLVTTSLIGQHSVKVKKAEDRVLASLDAEFNESFAWWAQVYDSESGGCFYSLSAKKAAPTDTCFAPDIESTSKLVAILQQADLLEATTPDFKANVIGFLQGRQDSESGLFRDPQHRDQYTHLTLSRVTSMALSTISDLGGELLYPPPMDNMKHNEEAAQAFAHLESPEALNAWMRALPWGDNTWEVGARLRHQWPFFRELPAERRKVLSKTVEQLVSEMQQPDGFFGYEGKENWGYRLSGTLKVFSFLHLAGIKLPQAEKVKETTLRILFNEDYDNSIIVYNTANLLNIIHQHGEEFDDELRLRIVERCTALLHEMRAPDGAFFTHTYRPTPVEMGKRLGQDVVESNSNATGLAHMTRNILIEFLTGESPPFPHPAGSALVKDLDMASRP
ncbi:hypothetical protein WJR50_29895 [Catalinimonas sp. 4WD22]|uniref:hypothetical protein n=1 Tax=Catalinimonas locisalis TaxID=3133978 RepID=UPI003101133B